MKVAGVVLAAGLSSRFGGPKPLAPLGGRPLLSHVLAAAAACGFVETVVVLGAGADRIEREIEWHGERLVRNPDPAAGLAGSLRVAVRSLGGDVEAACILLGDQPLVRPAVIGALLDALVAAEEPILVPMYADGGGRNPVLIRRSAWWLADQTRGDSGLGPIIAGHPELVREVRVDGANLDVDTPADLAAVETAIERATGSGSQDR